MSTSLLYHASGAKGHRDRRLDFVEGSVVFTIEEDRWAYCRLLCDSANDEFLKLEILAAQPTGFALR